MSAWVDLGNGSAFREEGMYMLEVSRGKYGKTEARVTFKHDGTPCCHADGCPTVDAAKQFCESYLYMKPKSRRL